MMFKPPSFLFPTLFLFGFLLNSVTCVVLKTQQQYIDLFNTLGDNFYKDRLLFFTGSDARSQIESFQRGWEAKLTQLCIENRPKEVLVLGDVLKLVKEEKPLPSDPDWDNFWALTSHAFATVASGTVYVLVPSDLTKWGNFYPKVERDILIANPKVQNVFELEFDGPKKGQVTKVVKGTKEFDSVDLLTAKEYEAMLGVTALENLNQEVPKLTPQQEARKAALFAKLEKRRNARETGGSGPSGGSVQ
ncbi:hypothetical protein L211DRAFT_840205 [Terfezia boudieri ATCC MYA-4762]|uniref:Uncharacterized protein n=1 Tax=Terfezia boudieri ATCC MYA-4762 TaxID=1051890 RepID=A0A3N4LGI9_9PEZI|nr:hypothetical protein L211DRAFT_840205 [Terfezia boudieri ATCC MYA-4762]